jgi:hypothetical protein
MTVRGVGHVKSRPTIRSIVAAAFPAEFVAHAV